MRFHSYTYERARSVQFCHHVVAELVHRQAAILRQQGMHSSKYLSPFKRRPFRSPQLQI